MNRPIRLAFARELYHLLTPDGCGTTTTVAPRIVTGRKYVAPKTPSADAAL